MEKDKLSIARDWILDQIESAVYRSGDPLPPVRHLCAETGISMLIAQQAIVSLCNDGILMSIPRRGTYVRDGWQKQILNNNLVLFRDYLPWETSFRGIIGKELPHLRLSKKFERGMYELRTTLYVQQHHHEYLDLTQILEELYPDRTVFFAEPFTEVTGRYPGRLPGIPFIFSPRVMFYNPDLLRGCDCPLPRPGWSWTEFVQSVRILRGKLSPEHIFNWVPYPYIWMNLILLADGALFDFDDPADPVKINHPATLEALRMMQKIRQELNLSVNIGEKAAIENFAAGKMAFMLAAREEVAYFRHANFDCWQTVELPNFAGGGRRMAQATDILCVRKECSDQATIRSFIQFMLSESMQNFIGDEKYGIPIRRDAALKSIDLAQERDRIFLEKIPCMSGAYHMETPEITWMIQEGIRQALLSDDDMARPLNELAAAVKTFLKIKQQSAS